MKAVGIIAEYNPFHNGHLYHLNKVKEMYPNDVIIVVLGGHFMQRGETSILNKWDKTHIALYYGADLVIELPYPFATQSADFFAKGAIQILKAANVQTLVFGSESNDVEKLIDLAKIQLESNEYQEIVKDYLNQGLNYPTALSKALTDITEKTIDTPNDILGIAYIKEIIKQEANIKPVTIKRTNDYHGDEIKDDVASASKIRKILKEKKDVKNLVPNETYKYLTDDLFNIESYFPYLKYQILNNLDNLDKFQTVDEGIENRIRKNIIDSNSLDDLIFKTKTKRYTYNKLRRMFTHIMCNFTKEEAQLFKDITYLKILGFNDKGQKYLNKIKNSTDIPLITRFSKNNDKMINLEFRTTCVYASIINEKNKTDLIKKEYRNNPIRIKKND